MTDKISVIIPVYNRSRLLHRAVASVIAQTHQDLEIIVVDDGSDDNPESALAQCGDPRIRYIRQQQAGVSAARNRGVSAAQYPLIAFLDSDDEWRAHKLQCQLDAIRGSDYPLCYTGEHWIRHGKPFHHAKSDQKYGGYVFEHCLHDCFIGCSTALIRKNIFHKIGGFDESLPVCEDYDLWLRLTAHYPVRYIKEKLINKYAGHGDQLSHIYWGLDQYRIQSIRTILNNGMLNTKQQTLARNVLMQKCMIVSKGCKKRKRYKDSAFYFTAWQPLLLPERMKQ